MTVADTIEAIRADLDQIVDWLRWAHTEGFTPTGPRTSTSRGERPDWVTVDPDGTPTEPDHQPDEHTDSDRDPDHQPGARHDTGIGDHRTRQAWHRATKALTAADDDLVLAAWCCGHSTQPGPSRVPATATQADRLLTTIRARLDLCDTDTPPARHRLAQARDHVDLAWRTLHGALTVGAANPDDHAVGEDMCLICRIRPTAKAGAQRCHTCQKFWQRSGRRQERPRSLDGQGVAEAKAALARRKARGEGWGDESLSATTPTPAGRAVVTSKAWQLARWWAFALLEGPLLEARVAQLAGLVDRFGRREERAELRRLRVRLDRLRRGQAA